MLELSSLKKSIQRIAAISVIIFILISTLQFYFINPQESSSHANKYDPDLFCSGDNGVSEANRKTRETVPGWHYSSLWTDDQILNDLIVEDVIPELPGDEIITVGDNDFVTLVTGDGYSWKAERLYSDFYVKGIAAGDIYPDHPGLEVVVASWEGYVTMLYYNSTTGQWEMEQIFKDYNYLYDVAVGDIDPAHPGDEIVTVGDSFHLNYIYYDHSTGSWNNEIAWKDDYYLSVVSVGEVLSSNDGCEIVVTGGSFDVTLVSGGPGSWSAKHIWHDSNFIQELEVAEVNASSKAGSGEILAAGHSKDLTMLSMNTSGNWLPETLWTDKTVVNDLLVLDYSNEYSGLELIAISGSGRIEMLYDQGGVWDNTTLYTLPNLPTKIVMGDFDSYNPGTEFAILEFKGRLTSLYTVSDGFTLITPLSNLNAFPGESFQIDLLVIASGAFTEIVYMSVENSTNFKIEFESTALVPTDFTGVSITVSESIPVEPVQITFTAATDKLIRYSNITINILEKTEDIDGQSVEGLNMTLEPRISYIVADYYTSILANLDCGTGSGEVSFAVMNEPLGIILQSDWQYAGMLGDVNKYMLVLGAGTNVPAGTYYVFIRTEMNIELVGDDNNLNLQRARVLQLSVEQLGSPDFFIEPDPANDYLLYTGEESIMVIRIATIGDFSESVRIAANNYNTNLDIEIDENIVESGEEFELKLTIKEDAENGEYYQIINVNFDDRIRFEVIEFEITDRPPGFNLTVQPSIVSIEKGENASLNVTISPEQGFTGKVQLRLFYGEHGHVEWEDYAWESWPSGPETERLVIDNLTEEGVYDFILKAETSGDFETQASFTVTVKPHGMQPYDDSDGDGDKDDDGLIFGLRQWTLMGVVLIIILILLGAISGLASRKRRLEKKRQAEAASREEAKGKTKTGPRRAPRARLSRLDEFIDKSEGKAELHTPPEDKGQFKLGEKVFKPGGSHDYDDFNAEEEKKKR